VVVAADAAAVAAGFLGGGLLLLEGPMLTLPRVVVAQLLRRALLLLVLVLVLRMPAQCLKLRFRYRHLARKTHRLLMLRGSCRSKGSARYPHCRVTASTALVNRVSSAAAAAPLPNIPRHR
jgi:hypothetical protein